MEPKQNLIRLAKANLVDASDNLNRAKHAFSSCTEEQLDQPYGQSGQTKREIVDGYQRWYDDAEATLKFAEGLS